MDIEGKSETSNMGRPTSIRKIHRSPYKGAQGIIIVFDLTNKTSFSHVKYYLRDIDKFAFESAKVLSIRICKKIKKIREGEV